MSNLVSDATLDNLEIIWRMILFQIRRAASCDVMGSSDWLLKSLKWGQLCEDLWAFYLHSYQNLYIYLPHSLLNTSLRSIWRWHRIFWLVDLMPWHLPGWWWRWRWRWLQWHDVMDLKLVGDTPTLTPDTNTAVLLTNDTSPRNLTHIKPLAFLRSNNTRKLLEQLWFGIITWERDLFHKQVVRKPPTIIFLTSAGDNLFSKYPWKVLLSKKKP